MNATAHTSFFTPANSDTVLTAVQRITLELKSLEWREARGREIAFSTRRTLFGPENDVRIVTTPVGGGSDVRISLRSGARRAAMTAARRRAIERLSARIQTALV